jgi:hypothetical protein
MDIAYFPGCCGGHVLYNFGHTTCTEGNSDGFDLDDMERQLEEYIQVQKHCAFLVITLNTEQREVYKEMLFKHGFRRKGSGYNAPHKSTVYVYIRFNHQN